MCISIGLVKQVLWQQPNKAVPSVINVNQTKENKNPSLLLTKLPNVLLNNFNMLIYILFDFCSLFRKCS